MPKGVYPHTHVKPKVYPPEMVERVRQLYESGLNQTEVGDRLGVSRRVIWRLMRNHQIPARAQAPRDQRGMANNNWRGEGATYAALHKRVEAARGRPQRCSACDTDAGGRYEWANLTGRYEDVSDYVRLCLRCHRRFDAHRREMTGRPTSPRGGGA